MNQKCATLKKYFWFPSAIDFVKLFSRTGTCSSPIILVFEPKGQYPIPRTPSAWMGVGKICDFRLKLQFISERLMVAHVADRSVPVEWPWYGGTWEVKFFQADLGYHIRTVWPRTINFGNTWGGAYWWGLAASASKRGGLQRPRKLFRTPCLRPYTVWHRATELGMITHVGRGVSVTGMGASAWGSLFMPTTVDVERPISAW